MSRWFRFYDEALNDPKILKLSDNLHRIWVGLLCVASKNEGRLPPVDDLALMIRIKPTKMRAALESLIKSGLIDDEESILSPHNWNGRQYKSDVSTERVKRFRNGKRNVSETPPDTEQIQKQILGADAPTPISKSKRTSSAIPEGFALDDAMRKFAGDRGYAGVNVERMFERFSDHHRAKGSRFADWQAAWRTWVGNQVQFDAQRNAPQQRRVPDV